MFFPFLAIYKMLSMSRRWVVIDFPILRDEGEKNAALRMDLQKDGNVHAFIFNARLLELVLVRLGIPRQDISLCLYNHGMAVTAVVKTENMARALNGG